MILIKSMIPLCPDDLMVMPPYDVAAVINPLELSLRPEAALALSTGNPYPLPVLLFGNPDGLSHLCLNMRDNPQSTDLKSELTTFSLDVSESDATPLCLALFSLS